MAAEGSSRDISELIAAWGKGDEEALSRLMSLLYRAPANREAAPASQSNRPDAGVGWLGQ
jgi:hypothetical protein